MNSLRSRLILGSSLIAVVPLAAAMFLLSQRIESTVRAQAAERLNATLGGLQLQITADARRSAEQLEILARDPQLKRLFLVRSGLDRDLAEYLAERRSLLGLDFLLVADTSGAVVGDAAAIARGDDPAWHVEATGGSGAFGVTIEPVAGDSALALTARAPVRYQNVVVGGVHGGRVLDRAYLLRLREASGVELALRDATGRVVTSTLADSAGRSFLRQDSPLLAGATPGASITGWFSTAAADQTIAALRITSGLLAGLGLLLAILLGVLWSSQISRPVERLAAFSDRLARGEWNEPLTLHSVREMETLVAALDRMRRDLMTYRDRLVTSERQAAWSQMARKVAHEVKNPLTPIAVSVADLKRSFDLERPDFPEILDQAVRTIGEEVETLKRLLQEFSDFGQFPAPRFAPCALSGLLSDLATLYGREVTEGRLEIHRPDRDVTFAADAGQMRQALVNLIKNGLEAVPEGGRVTVSADVDATHLEIAVSDTGPGLGPEQKANLFVPGFTTKRHGSGLGLTIVERIVSDHRGTIAIDTGAPRGTTFRIRLPIEPSRQGEPRS